MGILRQVFHRFREAIGYFGRGIAFLVNSLLLALVYFIGVGITSLIAKAFGKRFLEMKSSKKDSYWSELNLKKKPIESYYRQF